MTCEWPQVYSESMVKARKRHLCCECRKFIEPGALYVRAKGIWDYGPATYKTCADCDRTKKLAMKKWPPSYPDAGPPFGGLHDWIRECEE